MDPPVTSVTPTRRTFPNTYLGIWGAVAGVATLSGPIIGGVLIDNLGWEWIFFVNVPIGVVAYALAARYVPELPTHSHRFDVPGVVLSAVGMFLLVFGVQEGQNLDWDAGAWAIIIVGVAVLAGFVYWQRRTRGEPLVPLSLFGDRNFSLANISITTVGFAVAALAFPFMLYAQGVLGLSPLRAALLLIPMAGLSGVLAPWVGRLSDRIHPRYLAGFGLACFAGGLVWLSLAMHPNAAIWTLLAPLAVLGLGQGFIWSPLTTTATRNLPMAQAGAGSGVYNTTRQIGSVLGSAAIAVLMQIRLAAELPGAGGHAPATGTTGRLPAPIRDGFASAMGQSMLLPAAILALGFIAALFFELPAQMRTSAMPWRRRARPQQRAAAHQPG
jgi:EmrB/QacA subfamily drug resistance transporter